MDVCIGFFVGVAVGWIAGHYHVIERLTKYDLIWR